MIIQHESRVVTQRPYSDLSVRPARLKVASRPSGYRRMDIPGHTTQAGTRIDYYVGPRDYSTCAACGTRQQRTSARIGRLGMSEPM
jgi:hypothetical protein